jgi:signal transduction histidine kinase
VEDTGIGIDEEFLPDLFEEFKQESRGRGRTYEGNGLGLAISARLAEQMNGHIRVETEKDEGSTFTVEFPQASEETADQEEGDEP